MSINVSLVEDNKIYRASLVHLIGSLEGIKLYSAYANAEEARAILTEKPDIVIIDIELPGISGIELIRELKPLNQRILYLICSSYEDDEKIFSALEAGASGYIVKNARVAEIACAIRELYEGGSPMKASIARRVISSFQKKNGHPNYSLTGRETDILQLLAKGKIYKEIAEELSITRETVKHHLKHIYHKMHVQNKIEAINKFKDG